MTSNQNGHTNGYGATSLAAKPTTTQPQQQKTSTPCSTIVGFVVLCLLNILNFMDRYTVASTLTQIQTFYDINDAQGGLIQTVFVVSIIIISPISGYFGDRYSRKLIIIVGVTFWIASIIASSFIPKQYFWLFIVMRALVGVGEATYVVVSPSLIADMFDGPRRSKMIMVYCFAMPVGSGLGYIIGAAVASATNWQWSVRVTPAIGIVCLLLIILLIHEKPRGITEAGAAAQQSKHYGRDLMSLSTNYTFVFSSLAYTAVVFVAGTLTWWEPAALEREQSANEGLNSTDFLPKHDKNMINMLFGVVTGIGGFVGVAVGTVTSNWLRQGKWCFASIKTPRSDAIMCAVGVLLGIPSCLGIILTIPVNFTICYIMMFICTVGLSLNWAINVDMLMQVVTPARRSTGYAFQILTSHLLGDGPGPYIVGAISDAIRGSDDTPSAQAHSLTQAFYVPNAVLIIALLLFVAAAVTFPRDRRRFEEELGTMEQEKAALPQDDSLKIWDSEDYNITHF